MSEVVNSIPVVLTLSGSDPSGGAGIQADIESLASHGCHCAPVITVITVQDTQDVKSYAPLDGTLIMEQARAVLEDMPVAAIKIGLLGSTDAVEAIHGVLQDYPDIPVILDPVLASGNGTMTVRMGPWKLITALGSGGFSDPKRVEPGKDDPPGQLYNLAEDLAEAHNLYAQMPAKVDELTRELERIRND